jgi:hypothetical protein
MHGSGVEGLLLGAGQGALTGLDLMASSNRPIDEVGDVPTDRPGVPIPDGLRELLNSALTVIWDGIGPGGRDALRELQQTIADADEGDTGEIFRKFLTGFHEEVEQARRDPDLLVYGEMPGSLADELLARQLKEQTVIVDSVLLAHHDSEAVAEVSVALQTSVVSPSQEERIRAGLLALRNPGRTWAVPCDLLLGGVEGMLWDLAEAREIAMADEEGKPRSRDGRLLYSVNSLLGPDPGLELPWPLHQFLAERLFAGQGHNVRHRRQAQLQRDWTAYALVALRGVLDDVGGHQLVKGLVNRLASMLDGDGQDLLADQ